MNLDNVSGTFAMIPVTIATENTQEMQTDSQSNKRRKVSGLSLITPLVREQTSLVKDRKIVLADVTSLPTVLIDLITEYGRLPFPGSAATFEMIMDNSHLDATDPKNQFGLKNQFKPLIQLLAPSDCSNRATEKIFKTIVVNYTQGIRNTREEKKYVLLVEYWARLQSSIKEYFKSNDLHIPALTSDCAYPADRSFSRSFMIWTKSEAKNFLKLIGPPNNNFPADSFTKLMNLAEKFSD